MNISLIANSGIQFFTFELLIDPNADGLSSMGFYEFEDEEQGEVSFQYAYKVEDKWVPKRQLADEGYLDENSKIKKDVRVNMSSLKVLSAFKKGVQMSDYYYKINDIETCLDNYENIWLPFPYFKYVGNNSKFGPKAWSRVMFKKIKSKKKTETDNDFLDKKNQVQKYKVILAFDTKIDTQVEDYYTPQYDDTKRDDNLFGLSNNEDHNLKFLKQEEGCGYVSQYLLEVRHQGEVPEGNQEPHFLYLAEYLYILKYMGQIELSYLQTKNDLDYKLKRESNQEERQAIQNKIDEYNSLLKNGTFPRISFYSDKTDHKTVDLVLDIGNANTCGLLFESRDDGNFKFDTVEKLQIRDLSEVGNVYAEPFSMRLAFAEAKFGEIGIPEYPDSFKWPSIIRVGKEAQRLITKYSIDTDKGQETATNCSSPKRYLWDTKAVKIPWEYVRLEKEDTNTDDGNYNNTVPTPKIPNARVYCEGITEQFTPSGEYTFEVADASLDPYYSRKSLMTFVYIEIILQAISQINSFHFRDEHGEVDKPRKIRRIVITCPTSIVQKEQVILREAAVEAARTLKRYDQKAYNYAVMEDEIKVDFKIIPEPENLKKTIAETQSGEKLDWIYDEATCNQLVFMYAEVSKRYLNRADKFFDIYGKRRNDVEKKNQNALTLATVDIGGGTTDLMIAAYEYSSEQGGAVLTPNPLFFESFTLAGDDLVQAIVKNILLDGKAKNEEEEGYKGVLKNYAIRKNCSNVTEKMQNFFGKDDAAPNYRKRIFRKNFNVQVLVPIALRYLAHASSQDEDQTLTYEQIFDEFEPNEELILFINNHFGGDFDFREIQWRLSRDSVSKIIENLFDPLFKKLSILVSAYGSDFLLLSGRPTTIPKIKEMFVKYYSVSPDRIISMDTYRVGSWYPGFMDEASKADLGYIKDPKTIVAVGAIIALMGGRLDQLAGFKINTKKLIKELLPTTDFIGALDVKTNTINYIYFTPGERKTFTMVEALPVVLGYKQLPNQNYPARPIYKFDYNREYIRNMILKDGTDPYEDYEKDEATGKVEVTLNEDKVNEAINVEILKIKQKTPLKIKLVRNPRESQEVIEIEEIKGNDNDDINANMFTLSLMTLPEEDGYWLDTGEFVLQY